WVRIARFALSDYASALAARARIGKEFAAVWIYNRVNLDKPATLDASLSPSVGDLKLVGLSPGSYIATWWNTEAGKSMDSVNLTVGKGAETAELHTPPVVRDIALYVVRSGARSRRKPKNSGAA
ncbi:MAG TPA: hypothetical protein VGS41_15960, partial [Chthonomonadales bacterium]|nr:hypothetical protein [Chthonomonadales bacterium]